MPPRSSAVRTPLPGPRARQLIDQGAFDLQNVYRSAIFDDVASHGTTLVDVDGNSFLDLFSSFALGALGYNHPALLAVARSDAFVHAAANPSSTPFITTKAWVDFVDEVGRRFAPKGMSHVYFVDAGGEGVESALKEAFIVFGERRRAAAGEPRNPLELSAEAQAKMLDNAGTDAVVVSFAGAFHGRGLGPLSATHSKTIHKADMPAFPWPTVPFPAMRHPAERWAAENAASEAASLAALDDVLARFAGRVAAVIVEPVQSEGGDRHASPAFYRGVQARAKAAGAAFILDEVQTGVGISGTLWCHEQLDLPEPPDMVTFGKKMQLGGFFCSEAFTVRQFGRMYQTRNGDRARAMLALATLRALVDDDLLANVRDTGALFKAGLVELAEKFPSLISEPRGRGFLLAFDLPTPALRDEFLRRSMAHGVFATYTGTRSVRLRPHLITTPADVSDALATFEAVAQEMSA